MTATDLIEIILKATKNNYKLLFDEDNIEKYIDSSISFIEKDIEFKSLISSNDKDVVLKLEKLSKELSELKKDFEYFCKQEHKEYKNPMDTISYFILKYLNIIFKNNINLNDINAYLGYDLFVPYIAYTKLIMGIEVNIKNKEEDLSRKMILYDKKTNYDILKIALKVIHILSTVYKVGGKDAVKKTGMMNKICVNINEDFNYNRNARKTDLFDMVYGYDYLKNAKQIDDEKDAEALEELTDNNGFAKEFTDYEIIYLLYSYIVLYNKAEEIKSDNEDFTFKDLSEIANIIKKRSIDGIDPSKTIDDIASGKIKLNLSEQTTKHI